ncbi:hypothetical protein [Methanosalsum natronophilum]|nr:hypothetical protein [Methanosalsum natronophilum]MCS3923347.1 serine phosphatase RsbU (regulator of sigma subunit) [Methanosalsum natronophilum]
MIYNNVNIISFKSIDGGFNIGYDEDEMDYDEKMKKVCPVCGSSDLYYEVGGYMGMIYHCKNCDYIGALVVEANQEMIDQIREEYESTDDDDVKEDDDNTSE